MTDKKIRELIDRLDNIEAEQRANEGRITRIRLELLRELNKH